MSAYIPYDNRIEPIRDAHRALQDTFATISDQQRQWNSHVSETLQQTLNNLIGAGLNGYTLEFDDALVNRQSIALVMPEQRTGILKVVDEKAHRYSYTGARLVFSQLTNGFIDVTMQYAGISGLTLPKPPEHLLVVSCEQLTTEAVYIFVTDFINKINEAIGAGL